MKSRIIYIGIAIIAFFSFAAPICYFDMERDNPNDPVNRPPELLELFKLLASDGAASDGFGYSVSISSDGATIVVGAHGDDSSRGSAYVFTKSGGNWMQAAKLTASDGLAGDYFGHSVSISSDGTTIVVGADYDDVLANTDQGSAYVFVKPAGGWVNATEDAKLTASDGAADCYFGVSVSISSDGSVIVVGATGDNSCQGSAYVFLKGGGWTNATEDAKLTASDGAANDYFGESVSISSDGTTIVVGADVDDVLANNDQGSAYVFLRNHDGIDTWGNGSVDQAAKLTASDGAANDFFGISVSISSDGSTIVVGAVGDDSIRGSAYVFVKPGGGWVDTTENAKLTASDGATSERFGISVSISSDGSTIVMGASGDDSFIGSAYVFIKPFGGWATTSTFNDKLVASDRAADDWFGNSISISSDVSTIVVGSSGDDSGMGSTYVFGYGY